MLKVTKMSLIFTLCPLPSLHFNVLPIIYIILIIFNLMIKSRVHLYPWWKCGLPLRKSIIIIVFFVSHPRCADIRICKGGAALRGIIIVA